MTCENTRTKRHAPRPMLGRVEGGATGNVAFGQAAGAGGKRTDRCIEHSHRLARGVRRHRSAWSGGNPEKGTTVERHQAVGRVLGALLVGLQFAALAGLALTSMAGVAAGRMPIDAIIEFVAAFALGVWALTANRPGNFNIRPVPREGGDLVQHGPYRWIRHPMYSALLLAGLAAARSSADASAWMILAGLAVVLRLKAGIEEQGMTARHPTYREYQRRTRRFVPGLY